MEPYRPPSYPAVLGDLAYAAALALFLLLQRLGVSLRAHERDTWWASNGRDVVNAFAVTTVAGAIWLQGIAFPLALLFGAGLTLVLSLLHEAVLGRVKRPDAVVVAVAVAIGAPLVLAPRPVAEAAARALELAFSAR